MADKNGQCPGCNGRRILESKTTGIPYKCPLCDGTGSWKNYIKKPRWYGLQASAIVLTALQRLPGALTIDAIADFEVMWMASTQTGTFTTEIQDQSARAWQNLPVNNANMWGTIQLPFPVSFPDYASVIIPANGLLRWIVTDTSGAGNTIQPVLVGYELYEA